MKYNIYTDGACSGNPGVGGWGMGVFNVTNKLVYKKQGGAEKTTNNQMEMQAVLYALQYIKENNIEATIYTDSSYVYNTLTLGWYKKWRKNGWRTSTKEPVANQDIWQEILSLYEALDIEIEKVSGHSNNVFNNYVDKLAVQARIAISNGEQI